MLAAVGCGGGGSPELPDTAPFPYYGETLHFPQGTVAARLEQGDPSKAYARLTPNPPPSGSLTRAKYQIELGRESTGKDTYGRYALGFDSFPPGSPRTAIGDGYVMYCPRPQERMPAYYCAVLLRSLPLAAMSFEEKPPSREAALSLVKDAEAYLTRAKKPAERNGASHSKNAKT